MSGGLINANIVYTPVEATFSMSIVVSIFNRWSIAALTPDLPDLSSLTNALQIVNASELLTIQLLLQSTLH